MKKKMRHRDKVKLARKMLIRAELVSGTPIFESKGWIERAQETKKRVIEDEKKAKEGKNEHKKVDTC